MCVLCVRACMCVCVCVCVCVGVSVYTCTCAVHVHVYTYSVCIHCTYMYVQQTHTCMYACMCLLKHHYFCRGKAKANGMLWCAALTDINSMLPWQPKNGAKMVAMAMYYSNVSVAHTLAMQHSPHATCTHPHV